MTITVRPFDPSGFSMFNVRDGVGNRVTICVRQHFSEGLTADRQNSGIQIVIWGDFGAMENYWPACGAEPWWDWLEDTDQDYFLKKVLPGAYQEFDAEKTILHAKRQVIERRRYAELDKRQARQVWNDLAALDQYDSQERVMQVLSEATYTVDKSFYAGRRKFHQEEERPAFEEYYEMYYQRVKPSLVNFWDNLWRPFVERAKRTKGSFEEAEGALCQADDGECMA